MNPVAERVLQSVAPRVSYRYFQLLRASMSFEHRNREVLELCRRDPGHYVMAVWHSRLLGAAYATLDPARSIALLSRHRDARMFSAVLRRIGWSIAFGSSSRGGATGLREVVRRACEGFDVALTPDGPRGPRRRVKPGAIAIARLTGFPIVPLAFSATRVRRLGSWDRTLLPKLGSKGLYLYGSAIVVPEQADAGERERLGRLLESELDRLTDEADRLTGLEPEEPRPAVVQEPA